MKDWENETVPYKLKFPVKWENDEYVTELKFKAPKGEDLMGLDFEGDKIGALIKMASKTNNISPSIIKKLHIKDIMGVAEVVGDFLDDTQ